MKNTKENVIIIEGNNNVRENITQSNTGNNKIIIKGNSNAVSGINQK